MQTPSYAAQPSSGNGRETVLMRGSDDPAGGAVAAATLSAPSSPSRAHSVAPSATDSTAYRDLETRVRMTACIGALQFARTGSCRPAARETPLNPKPVEPSVLDWAAEWLHREVPALSDREAKRLILSCVVRRQDGKLLSVTERRWLQAWDHVADEWRSHTGEGL